MPCCCKATRSALVCIYIYIYIYMYILGGVCRRSEVKFIVAVHWPAKQEKRTDNRAGHRTRSLENRTKRFPERCKYDENSTINRRKHVLGQFGTIKVHSAAARDTPERLRSAKKLLRIRSESPRAAPRRSRKRPGSVLEAPGTP